MVDKTTEGVVAEPEEVEAVLHNLCGYHLAERDPIHRYTVLTREQVLYEGLVSAIRRERGRALAELVGTGQSMTQVAAMTNLRTRQRVQRLIAIAKAADEAVAKVQAASLEFEAKLAAVEATLDEVLNGVTVANPSLVDGTEPDVRTEHPAVLEPTQAMPALAAVLNPTREMPGDNVPWWRRGRDTGAA